MYNKNIIPVLNFLNNHPIEKLSEDFGIKIKDYKQFIVLNYCQLNTPKTDPRWHDCRGLIVRKQPKGSYTNKDILSRPFTRFFNFGETFDTTDFNFGHSIAYDKIDGSLSPVWFNPFSNRWEVSTRQMAYAEGTTSFGNSYRRLFLDGGHEGSEENFQIRMNLLNNVMPGYTWIFEMTSPETRVVTPYNEKSIWFLAARNNMSGQYLMANAIRELLVECIPAVKFPNEYYFSTPAECELAAKNLPALEEGYVLYDPSTQNRVKIKSGSYVQIHHMRDNGVINPKRILSLIMENEYEEYLVYFESDRELFEPYIRKYNELKVWIENTYNDIKDIESQKNFALEAIKTPFSGILFEMRKGVSLNNTLEKMQIEKIINILDSFK